MENELIELRDQIIDEQDQMIDMQKDLENKKLQEKIQEEVARL